jgi:hypothetical protein
MMALQRDQGDTSFSQSTRLGFVCLKQGDASMWMMEPNSTSLFFCFCFCFFGIGLHFEFWISFVGSD